MAHTPGPWWVQVVKGIGVGVFGTRGTMGEPVAQVYSAFSDVQKDNATLIAAAPAMLAEPESVRDDLALLVSEGHIESYGLGRIDALIAKARGE